jgi:uncharacterized protein YjbI with pentapeptide repeats
MVFPAADLSFINLAFADLTNCTFAPGTNLTGANFTGARLVNANLSGCILDNANFRGADLSFAVLACVGGADFRGANLTGVNAPAGCAQCVVNPNLKDQCTLGDPPALCMLSAPFRGIVAGVVFNDLNSNGTLDLGEPGLPGVPVQVTDAVGPNPVVTDSRGAYLFVSTAPAPATAQVGPLPVGYILTGAPSVNANLAICRSGQSLNFSATTPATPTVRSSFGQLKMVYR